jgi:hypothetical protein
MPFPNFYVPSVGVKFATVFLRSRMSLSHLGGRELNLLQIFQPFVTANQTRNAPGCFEPKKRVRRPPVCFEARHIEDAIVVPGFLAEFSIDADWQVDLNPPRRNSVGGDVLGGRWVHSIGACRDR